MASLGGVRAAPARLAHRVCHPSTTVRSRLAATYGGLFLASGIALLAITYELLDRALPNATVARLPRHPHFHVRVLETLPKVKVRVGNHSFVGPQVIQFLLGQRGSELHALLVYASIALAVMTVVAVGLGWLIAGRVLRPLRTITSTTREISEDNLHRRLGLSGRRDELCDLSDTIDGLLARLESAFEAERSFVANASHELRTPLTVSRAMLQVALADPDGSVDSLRSACEEAIEAGRQQEHLIDSLLTLARSHQGLDATEPVDLAAVTTEVAKRLARSAEASRVRLRLDLQPTGVAGEAELLERLVLNLVDNAVRYNTPGGNVEVRVRPGGEGGLVSVVNTGPVVPEEQVERLLRPFQRLATERTGERLGMGLGLSIVRSITEAHGGELTIRPRTGGGLQIEVSLPAVVG